GREMTGAAVVSDKQRRPSEQLGEVGQLGRSGERPHSLLVSHFCQYLGRNIDVVRAADKDDVNLMLRYQKLDQGSQMRARPLTRFGAGTGMNANITSVAARELSDVVGVWRRSRAKDPAVTGRSQSDRVDQPA